MQWELIAALIIAIPVILFPAAYVWYINIRGLTALVKNARLKKAAREAKTDLLKNMYQHPEYEKALTEVLEKYPW